MNESTVKGLKWYGCSIPAAVDIAQLAHTVEESILCREGWQLALPK